MLYKHLDNIKTHYVLSSAIQYSGNGLCLIMNAFHWNVEVRKKKPTCRLQVTQKKACTATKLQKNRPSALKIEGL